MTTAAPASPATTRECITVLLVDDDPDLAQQVRWMLRESAVAYAIEVHDGCRAGLLARLRAGGFDVCLLDHLLADVHGDEVLRSYQPPPAGAPVIVLTGALDPALAESYLALGAADFLSKEDLTPRHLDLAIRFAVRQNRLLRELDQGRQALLRGQRLATVGMLSSGVAHEFNNLNALVLARIERVLRDVAIDAPARGLLQECVELLAGSRTITRSLHQLAKPSRPSIASIDLVQAVERALVLLDNLLRQRGIAVERAMVRTPVWVRGDVGDFHQVLVHLLVNAVHALWRCPRPVISLRLWREGDWVRLAVGDNGVGIPEADLAHLFEPFFSRKSSGGERGDFPDEIEGAGLGLAVCQSLCQRHGGDIAVRSRSGAGSTFTVTVPSAPPPQSRATTGPYTLTPEVRGYRIHIVEDNLDLLAMVEDLLRASGLTVACWDDGERFLAAAARERPQVVLADWDLPGLAGDELIARLGLALGYEQACVVVMSGLAPALPKELPANIHVVAVLEKPAKQSELIGAVARACVKHGKLGKE